MSVVNELNAGSGVPDYIFTPGFRGTVITRSGAELACKVTEDEVVIEDITNFLPDNETYRFSACARPTTIKGYETELRGLDSIIYMRNPSFPLSRQPDIRPAALFGQTIAYLDGQRPLDTIEGMWFSHGFLHTNYNAFFDALGADGLQAPQELQQKAAFATWTGRQALRHGFDRAVVNTREAPSGLQIHANFIRPYVDLY